METLKELQDDINLKEEENKRLNVRISELEAGDDVAKETLTENDMLKVKLETLESNLKEKLDLIYKGEAEIMSLKDQLSELENSSEGKEEMDRLKAELDTKVEIAQEKVKVIEAERDEVRHMAETLKTEKEVIEKVIYALPENFLVMKISYRC